MASHGVDQEKVTREKVREPFNLDRWIREHPLQDIRFSFFIFILIPVQTLFAHQWLTLPQYVDRAFEPWVSQNMEFFVNLNPLLIFVLTPVMAALTSRVDVYRMMIIGTAVMAAPTFLLALGPNVGLLMTYIVLMSVGEAMWQPRFLQLAAELAPEGKTGQYMGIAQFPWFLTKLLTSLYSGTMLTRYVPEVGPQNSEMLWLMYAFIAMLSPISLFLARKWMGGKLKTTAVGASS
jgi:MFS family permease